MQTLISSLSFGLALYLVSEGSMLGAVLSAGIGVYVLGGKRGRGRGRGALKLGRAVGQRVRRVPAAIERAWAALSSSRGISKPGSSNRKAGSSKRKARRVVPMDAVPELRNPVANPWLAPSKTKPPERPPVVVDADQLRRWMEEEEAELAEAEKNWSPRGRTYTMEEYNDRPRAAG